MYNLFVEGSTDDQLRLKSLFGDRYDLTDDLSQANVLVVCGAIDTSAREAVIPDSEAVIEDSNLVIPDSKLLFAVCDMTEKGLSDSALLYCLGRGIAVFRNDSSLASVAAVRDFIENGNVAGCTVFPEIDLGPFGNDQCRIIIMMNGIDDPILLAAMMFSGLDVRAIAGGLYIHQNPDDAGMAQEIDQNPDGAVDTMYGCALVALREPVTRIPHLDGVVKVRVLQDI